MNDHRNEKDGEKDRIIAGMENGSLQLEGKDAKPFFETLLRDTRQGFFADPIYGGNRDMAAWKMIGFPGVDDYYLTEVDRYNMVYTRAPTGIAHRAGIGTVPFTPQSVSSAPQSSVGG